MIHIYHLPFLPQKNQHYKIVERLLSYPKSHVVTKKSMIKKDTHGKLYYPNSPLQFSLSHHNNQLIVAIHTGSVGVDVECSKRIISERVAKKVSHSEQSILPLSRLDTWIAKESAAKYWGEGFVIMKHILIKSVVEKDGCIYLAVVNTLINETAVCSIHTTGPWRWAVTASSPENIKQHIWDDYPEIIPDRYYPRFD